MLRIINELNSILVTEKTFSLFEGFLRLGLEAIGVKTSSTISIEELWLKCFSGASSLFIVHEIGGSSPIGFYVLTIGEHSDKVSVDICPAFSSHTFDTAVRFYSLQKVCEFAIIVSAEYVTFSSSRRGALKQATKVGFKCYRSLDKMYYFSKQIKGN